MISNIMVKAITVITTPIFTRLMSTEEYGTVQTFISWYSLLLPILSLNLTYSIGRAKLDFPNKLDEYIGSMQTLSAVFSIVLSAIAIIFIKPVSSLFEITPLQTGLLLAYIFFQIAILLNQNGYRYTYKYRQNIAIAWYTTLFTTILSLVLILTVGGDRADLRIIGITVPTVLLSLYFWGKSVKDKSLNFNVEYWKYALTISLPLVLHTISLNVLGQSDRIFITKIWGKTDTAYYSLAYTYGVLLHVFTNAISESWLPWFHDTYFEQKFDEIRKNVKPLILFGCYIGLASIAFAPEAIMILGGKTYSSSISCVPPIVLGIVCQYIYTHYVNIELHLKKTIYVSVGTIVAALFNIITNAIFIPIYGFAAAAYTTLASYFLLMVIHLVITKKVLHVKLYNDLFMFGAMFITGGITALLMFSYQHRWLRYGLIAIGFISFVYYFRDYAKNWIRNRKKKTQGK